MGGQGGFILCIGLVFSATTGALGDVGYDRSMVAIWPTGPIEVNAGSRFYGSLKGRRSCSGTVSAPALYVWQRYIFHRPVPWYFAENFRGCAWIERIVVWVVTRVRYSTYDRFRNISMARNHERKKKHSAEESEMQAGHR
jgi:hypothetical protein